MIEKVHAILKAMKRTPLRFNLSTLVPLIVGVIICIEVRAYFSAKSSIEEPRYLVARRNVPAEQPITSIHFTLVTQSASSDPIPKDALTDQDLYLVKGGFTNTALRTGQPLTLSMVNLPSSPEALGKLVPRGMRAYTLRETDTFDVRPGDRVDIHLNPSDERAYPVTLAEGIAVLRTTPSELIVAVTSSQIQLLEKGRRKGRLTIVLRNPQETVPTDSSNHRNGLFGTPKLHRSIEILSEGQ